ncbi:DUF2254 domain-containing protein [Corynebacterium guangdongense]|uniref:Membrane protein n=1 Tax=Corynebacterium guangdongense TaxID=1783348 RepID=A0ABU2A0I1_9CORY|nr:DUF2254 family protein [Corynebacterium guangdongense]MDR7330698.1 putative membrane protein [Corynebacterium guangdongense]WJZ16713.1 hypothetical protein CGUA_00520 [Corynebacterium guangdongense]
MKDNNRETSESFRLRGSIPDVPRETLRDRLWRPFWAIPTVSVVAAVVLGVLLPTWERGLSETPPEIAFGGGPSAAREVLGTIASATISVTGLIFSITLVVLQLVSSQFSPRMLNGFLRNRIVQATLAMFLGTFVFSLTVLRYVWSEDEELTAFVPRVSVSLAFLLVLGCLGLFMAFIRTITSSMRVANAISEIGKETMALAERIYPVKSRDTDPTQGPGWSPRPDDHREEVPADSHGSLVWIDYRKLISWATEHGAVITVDRSVGEFLVEGQPLLRIWWEGKLSDRDRRILLSTIEVRTERELHQDVAFGLRQLVDIADRALSPGINDPATAAQCVQELHRIFRYLVTVTEPSPYIADEDGQVRVVHHPQRIGAMLHEVVREIHLYGAGSAMIPTQLRIMLEDLTTAATEQSLPAVERARTILDDDDSADKDKGKDTATV